jgi:hypothetical protein
MTDNDGLTRTPSMRQIVVLPLVRMMFKVGLSPSPFCLASEEPRASFLRLMPENPHFPLSVTVQNIMS